MAARSNAASAARKVGSVKTTTTKVNGGTSHSKDKNIAVFANFKPRAGDKLTPKQWASKINAAWQKSAGSLLETARLVKEARGDLPMGKYRDMQKYLDMGESDISKLCAIGNCEVMYRKENMPKLPPKFSVMYLLALIPEDSLQELFDKNDIHLNMSRKCAEELKKKFKLTPKLEDDDDEEYYDDDEDDVEGENDNEPDDDNDEETEADEEDDDEADEDEDEDEVDDDEDEPVASAKKSNDPPKEGFELHLENWHHNILSGIDFCGVLEESLEATGKCIPSKELNDALRLSKLLQRLCKDYK